MKGKKIQSLTPRQLQVLPHIIASPSYEEAARRANINPKQIYAWLKEAQFREELQRQRNATFYEALGILKTTALRAVQVLASALEEYDPRIRLAAADKILGNIYRGIELFEIEERLRVVEERVDKTIEKQGTAL